MGKPLEQTEYIGKWMLAILVIVGFLSGLWSFLKKSYLYIKKSNERFEMLLKIIENQEYEKMERQAIMDKISLGHFKTDLEGQSIEISDVVCKIFGYSEKELLRFGWSSFIHEEDQEYVMESIKEDLKYKRNGDLKYRIRTSSGEIKRIHVTAKRSLKYYFCTLEVIK